MSYLKEGMYLHPLNIHVLIHIHYGVRQRQNFVNLDNPCQNVNKFDDKKRLL